MALFNSKLLVYHHFRHENRQKFMENSSHLLTVCPWVMETHGIHGVLGVSSSCGKDTTMENVLKMGEIYESHLHRIHFSHETSETSWIVVIHGGKMIMGVSESDMVMMQLWISGSSISRQTNDKPLLPNRMRNSLELSEADKRETGKKLNRHFWNWEKNPKITFQSF